MGENVVFVSPVGHGVIVLASGLQHRRLSVPKELDEPVANCTFRGEAITV